MLVLLHLTRERLPARLAPKHFLLVFDYSLAGQVDPLLAFEFSFTDRPQGDHFSLEIVLMEVGFVVGFEQVCG